MSNELTPSLTSVQVEQEDDVYDEVTEDEYRRISAKRRSGSDFVVDDGTRARAVGVSVLWNRGSAQSVLGMKSRMLKVCWE